MLEIIMKFISFIKGLINHQVIGKLVNIGKAMICMFIAWTTSNINKGLWRDISGWVAVAIIPAA